ncbi:MAG: NAD(P)-dependent oxidoreductase [Erysipelotrichia bacterium]|nr:NAD(P)-dependent oxidoreductase [Erysipelotrichia bacterium]
MKVFIVGGTGLLGSEAARELIKRGHEVTSISLPPIPVGANLPKEMKIEFGNYVDMPLEELEKHLIGVDWVVFAAGVDERIEAPAPSYDFFKKYNIDGLEKIMKVAKRVGVKHVNICGSYFSHFAKKWPKEKLTKYHPYIRSRIDQEIIALSYADEKMSISILELPYIFGVQEGRKPVWVFLIEIIKAMKRNTYYPKGGTSMVSVKQVAEGIAGALENIKGGVSIPFGYYNMEWKEFLGIVHKYMGYPKKRRVITIPSFLLALRGFKMRKEDKKKGIESGLNIVRFAKMMATNLFIDPSEGALSLGVKEDDIEKAIGDSVKLSLDIINKSSSNIIDMKGE